MSISLKRFLLLILLTGIFVFNINAQKKNLVVGTKIAEPFVIKEADGSWDGITFDLWREIAINLDLEYEVKEYDLSGLLDAVESGEIDIAVSPLTLTAEREERFDFTHPYYTTSLGIAVKSKKRASILTIAKSLISVEFWTIVGVLTLILFAVGFLIWLFEKKTNEEQFGGRTHHGLGSSFWWAAVTMTTVGYGDKAPRTFGGRIIALIWMFAGIIMISSITAAITSALTVSQLDTNIKGVEDLYSSSVGTVKSSSSEKYLNEKRISSVVFDTPEEIVKALSDEKIEAAVYDAPILKYLIKSKKFNELSVLPNQLEPLYYGLALPRESKLKEKLNREILNIIDGEEWQNILYGYLGEKKK